MHCSLNINDSFEVDKRVERVVMWPFLPAERLCRWSIVYDYCKKNDMQTYFNVDEGKPRKPPLVFQWNLKPFLWQILSCPNGSSQQNWKRKQYKSMETEPLSLIKWTENWTTKLRKRSKVAEITKPKTDQYPFF